jgi:hypothetical protein
MSKNTTAPRANKPKKPARQTRWLDPKSQTPLIDDYAQKMQHFLQAMADGVVEESEVKKQEKRLVAVMKEIEPRLDEDLHEKVTQLLCELTVYDMMQVTRTMQQLRTVSRFRG